jgi:GNAT superfamily N-acetyltransferase
LATEAEGVTGTEQQGHAVRVRKARPEEVDAVARVIAEAFRAEGFTNHLLDLSTPQARQRLVAETARAMGLKWHAGGTFLVAVEADRIVGVAVLSFPGQRPRTPLRRRLVLQARRLTGILGLLRWVRWRNVPSALRAMRPSSPIPQPHAVLVGLAVKPEHQGQGIARLLLDASHGLAENDPSLAGMYLYTGDLRNTEIYARFGYGLLAGKSAGRAFTAYHMFRRRGATQPGGGSHGQSQHRHPG